jgi:hypothetical protein
MLDGVEAKRNNQNQIEVTAAASTAARRSDCDGWRGGEGEMIGWLTM